MENQIRGSKAQILRPPWLETFVMNERSVLGLQHDAAASSTATGPLLIQAAWSRVRTPVFLVPIAEPMIDAVDDSIHGPGIHSIHERAAAALAIGARVDLYALVVRFAPGRTSNHSFDLVMRLAKPFFALCIVASLRYADRHRAVVAIRAT